MFVSYQKMNFHNELILLFVCKSCRGSFETVAQFIEHKQLEHFKEFENVKCIIFEEGNSDVSEAIEASKKAELDQLSDLRTILTLASCNQKSSSSLTPTKTEETTAETETSSEIIENIDLFSELYSGPFEHDYAVSFPNLLPPVFAEPIFSENYNNTSVDKLQSSLQEDEVQDDTNVENVVENLESEPEAISKLISTNSFAEPENHSDETCDSNNVTKFSVQKLSQTPVVLVSRLTSKEIANFSNLQRLGLKYWLKEQQNCSIEDGALPNMILLDPDPTKIDLGPIDKNPIACRLCCKKLSSEQEVKIHVTNCWFHNSERHRYCVPCKKVFSRPIFLQKHALTFHGTKEDKQVQPKFKCLICAKELSSRNRLNFHLESHKSKEEQNRPFICTVCGFAFRTKLYLADHMPKHSDERPFICKKENCNASFKIKCSLYKHLRTHAETREFSCHECSKTFKLKEQLKKHFQVHVVDRPFACTYSVCTLTFKSKSHLINHEREHRGEILFLCNMCGKSYRNRWSYRSHLERHKKKGDFIKDPKTLN